MEEQDLGYGNKIIGFNSYEEMVEYMNDQELKLLEAMQSITTEQVGITFGSYALRLVYTGHDQALAIFGRVEDVQEVVLAEKDAGSTPAELAEFLAKYVEMFDKGYRFGKWFSVVCPEGELGDAHITTLWPITEADYHHALNNGWEMPRYLADRVRDEMRNATPGSGA